MALVRPFRALRYDEAVAGPLAQLVAPPYDVIDDAARREYLARSPYNVVHLTLPDSEEQARAAVDRGEAVAAFLVRAPTIAQVAEFAARGEVMPQKSTFFYPKLTSGLLF